MAEDTSAAAANPPAPVEVASGPVHNGPVVNPPDNLAPPAEASAPNVAADSVAPAVSVDGLPYTVKRGDSLAKIAHRHHIALAKLRAANSLASDSLHIGQKLVIPGREPKAAPADAIAAATPAATPASPAPTAPVAQPVTAADLSGSLASPSVADTALPTHAHKTTSVHHLYTVVKGDTLTKIAKRYHTTTSAIMAANNLTNAGRLSIGQKLHIPSHQMREATAEEPAPQETAPHTAAKGQLANYTP
jgi:LysM repeat protein